MPKTPSRFKNPPPTKKTHRELYNLQRSLFSEHHRQRTLVKVFECGTYKLTLRQLTRDLDCPFPMSARRLQTILEANEIGSLKQLFDIGLHGLGDMKGVGDSLCDVATVILDHADYDLVEFCGWEEGEVPVRFQTIKARQKAQKDRRELPADKPYLPSDFEKHDRKAIAH